LAAKNHNTAFAQRILAILEMIFAVPFIPRNDAIRDLFIVNKISRSYSLLDRKLQ